MKIFKSRKTKIHRHVLLAAFAIASLITSPRAQQPAATAQSSSEDRIALNQALLDLQNPWTVMCVAAHPDDEDGTSLIVMRRKFGAHTVSLFSTFGEGGQNAIGPELYEEMGAIRARETMAAAEIQGSEPHFLGLKDFGFSKTRDEAFRFWGHEEGLRRMVLEIRKLRPDVIITNHSTTSNDHGQHQATALMVVEAFDAAADPNKFPEQLKDGVTTWQVQRLFVRSRGNQAQNADAQIVTIDPNETDPVRGVVYAEEALRALQKHATQGPWPKTFAEYANRFRAFSGQPGAATGQLPMIRYTLVRTAKSAAPMPAQEAHNFLDGLRLPDPSWQRATASLSAASGLIDNRQQLLQSLFSVAREFNHASSSPAARTALFDERLNAALTVAARISIDVSPETEVIPGTAVNFVVKVRNMGGESVSIHNIDLDGLGAEANGISAKNIQAAGQTFRAVRKLNVPANTNVTVPHAAHLYDGLALGDTIMARVSVDIAGQTFVSTSKTRVDVVPPLSVSGVSPSAFVITPNTIDKSHSFQVQVVNYTGAAVNSILAIGAADNSEDAIGPILKKVPVALVAHESKTVNVELTPGELHYASLKPSVARGGYKLTFAISSPALGSKQMASTREMPFADAKASTAPNLRVAYVRGFDFSLPNALNALGVESRELSVDEVKTADLSKYTSVIVDNRVYESKPELIATNQKLLDYANAGGNLIVFYHKSDEWNPDPRRNRPQLAPYKLILGNERVTDENAPITFIEPDHPLLNVPNKMNQDDFKDWIQERGLYYPREWDPQFHALLQSNDPGEQPLKGGLLVADYGKGHYIYTSMVWYRELRGGIPGAYRMLANMISYGEGQK
jgi:LmbE family N-acetylglucosaminyl deacetylase